MFHHVNDVAATVLTNAKVSLLPQDADERAHRAVTGRIVHGLAHLGDGRLAEAVDDVHDLTFPATETIWAHACLPDLLLF